jgi:DNA helicase-2/ATP-dependent DNA helicase PcrA
VAAVQLAAYRLAWADLSGTELSRVRAAFVYLRDGAGQGDYSPTDLLDRDGLSDLLRRFSTGPQRAGRHR